MNPVHDFFYDRAKDILSSENELQTKRIQLRVLRLDIVRAYRGKPEDRPEELLREIEVQLSC